MASSGAEDAVLRRVGRGGRQRHPHLRRRPRRHPARAGHVDRRTRFLDVGADLRPGGFGGRVSGDARKRYVDRRGRHGPCRRDRRCGEGAGGHRTGAFHVRRRFPRADTTATATVAVREPGAPTELTLRLAPKGGSFELGFEGRSSAAHLDGIPRLGAFARGHATARVAGTYDLGSDRLDAEVQASAGDVRIGGALLHDATLVARADGKLASPRIDADLHGSGFEAGPIQFASIQAESHGTLTRAPVEVALLGQDAQVHARADVEVGHGLTLRDVTVALERQGQAAKAGASLVRVGGGETRVDDVELDGLGAPLRATLRAVARSPVREGPRPPAGPRTHRALWPAWSTPRAAASRSTSTRSFGRTGPRGASFWISRRARSGGGSGLQGATSRRRSTVATCPARRPRRSPTSARSSSGRRRWRSAASDLPSWTYWKRAWGAPDADAHVDLAKLAAQPPAGAPFRLERSAGVVDARAHVERDSMSDATPGVDVIARTTGLALASRAAPRSGWSKASKRRGTGAGRRATPDIPPPTAARGRRRAARRAQRDVRRGPVTPAVRGGQSVRRLPRMPFQAELTVPPATSKRSPPCWGRARKAAACRLLPAGTARSSSTDVDLTAALHRGQADVRLLALPVDWICRRTTTACTPTPGCRRARAGVRFSTRALA